MSYLSTIARLTASNIGGLVQLQVVRAADISAIQDPEGDTIYGNISLNADVGWQIWRSTSETMEVVAQNQDGQEGDYKNISLPFFLPKDRPGLKQMLDLAESDEFVVLYKDGNGNQKLFGTPDRPVIFKYNHNTSAAHEGRNGYECRFEYAGPDNIYFYDGSVTAPPAGPAPTILRINGVVQLTAPAGSIIDVNTEFKITDFKISNGVS